MTASPEDWKAIATRAMATLDAIRAYVEPYHLAAITPTSGDVVPDDYQRGLIHGLDHVYQLATADPTPDAPSPATVATAIATAYATADGEPATGTVTVTGPVAVTPQVRPATIAIPGFNPAALREAIAHIYEELSGKARQ